MRNITLSADETLIEKVRAKAQRTGTTLNASFREWLAAWVGDDDAASRYEALMNRLGSARAEDIQDGQQVGDLTIVNPFRRLTA